MIHRRFYIALGKLLYAMAKADGIIQDKERVQFEKFISDELKKSKPVLKDHPAPNAILLSKLSFSTAEREKIKVSDGLKYFEDFMKKYDKHLLAEEKKFAHELIKKTALAYGGISKEEETILDSLLIQ
jgi:hypothetical protein